MKPDPWPDRVRLMLLLRFPPMWPLWIVCVLITYVMGPKVPKRPAVGQGRE